MKTDELIDDVARRMTETAGRPDLRTRVMAGIGDEARDARRPWLVPALAGGAIACAALVWMLIPATAPESSTPVATTARVAAPPAPEATREAASAPERPAPIATTTRVSISNVARRTTAVESAEPPAWTDVPDEWTIPTLPPLAGPPPIVIVPLAWEEVTIAPLTVASIEVKALEIEPLDARGVGGV